MTRWTLFLTLSIIAAPLTARAADCHNPDCRPDVIPAEGRRTPPPGYRKQTRHFQGPLIGGFASATVGLAMMGYGADLRGRGNGMPNGAEIFIVMGGAAFITGASLITYGLLGHEEVFVRDRLTVSVAPVIDRKTAGGALRLEF
jgi:hypothetical protein